MQGHTISIAAVLPCSDIVGDFVVSMLTEEELRQSHRRLVDLLRAGRPVDPTSNAPEWNSFVNNSTSQYVSTYSVVHVRQGWDPTWENDEHAMQKWLGDYPQARLLPNAATAACSWCIQSPSTLLVATLASLALRSGRYRQCSRLIPWLREGVSIDV